MSYKKGFRNGVKKEGFKSPKRDGLFGSSFLESDKSRNKAESYSKGYQKGDKVRKSSMNLIQRIFD